jgi:hypothetical protein
MEMMAMQKETGMPINMRVKNNKIRIQITISPLHKFFYFQDENGNLIDHHKGSAHWENQISISNWKLEYWVDMVHAMNDHLDTHMDHDVGHSKNDDAVQHLSCSLPTTREAAAHKVHVKMFTITYRDGCAEEEAPLEKKHGKLLGPGQR